MSTPIAPFSGAASASMARRLLGQPLKQHGKLTRAKGEAGGRFQALDGLRGVAILLVVAFHTGVTIRGGHIGVDLFFVLSGYLITTLLLAEVQKTGRLRLGRFLLRRLVRLGPSLVVTVAGTLLCAACFDICCSPLAFGLSDSPWVIAGLANWRFANNPTAIFLLLAHTWSLSIEWQFYVVWPLVLTGLVALKARRRWYLALMVAGVIVPALLRVLLYDGSPTWLEIYLRTDTRVDGLFWGCLIAGICTWRGAPMTRLGRYLLRAAAVVAVAVIAWHASTFQLFTSYQYYFGYTVVNTCAACVVLAIVAGVTPLLRRLLELTCLRWLGHISYSVYLCHCPLIIIVMPWLPEQAGTQFVILVAVALACGAVFYAMVERPSLWLKDWLTSGRAAGAGALLAPDPVWLGAAK
jgi:peptidoglycan/LPS O-acetylase OafA/YrhL